jgi:hypothetical protein
MLAYGSNSTQTEVASFCICTLVDCQGIVIIRERARMGKKLFGRKDCLTIQSALDEVVV